MNNQTRKWIRGGMETLVHGGTAALMAGLVTPNVVGQLPLPYFSKQWWVLVGTSFAANGGVRFLQWWQNNPLPPDETDPGIGEPQKIGLNPLSKVMPAPTPANGATKP